MVGRVLFVLGVVAPLCCRGTGIIQLTQTSDYELDEQDYWGDVDTRRLDGGSYAEGSYTPETSTPAPETPTPAPETPTGGSYAEGSYTPETPTPAPETPTPAPETPTPAPETPTPAPETPTPATETPTLAPETPPLSPPPSAAADAKKIQQTLSFAGISLDDFNSYYKDSLIATLAERLGVNVTAVTCEVRARSRRLQSSAGVTVTTTVTFPADTPQAALYAAKMSSRELATSTTEIASFLATFKQKVLAQAGLPDTIKSAVGTVLSAANVTFAEPTFTWENGDEKRSGMDNWKIVVIIIAVVFTMGLSLYAMYNFKSSVAPNDDDNAVPIQENEPALNAVTGGDDEGYDEA